MRVELIFVDTKEQTKRGFLRGFVALALAIIPLHWLLGGAWWRALIVAVLLSSALAVAHPLTLAVAAMYGALVGLVLFGTVFATEGMSAGAAVLAIGLSVLLALVLFAI